MQSIAELQDFFEQYYVKNFEDFDSNLTKVENIKNKKNAWFYSTPDGYVVDDEGHALYLIDKEKLMLENPKLQIKGGDAGENKYKDYYLLNDVYGVTSDLKVYYCSNGIASIRGIDKNKLDLEDLSRSVISNSNPLAQKIPHAEGKDLTIQDLRNVDSLTIEAEDLITNLNEFYRLSSLSSLTIKSKKNNEIDLSGLRNVFKLKYLCFYDCDLNDYSCLSSLNELETLYLYKSCNDEVDKVFTAMKEIDYLKLRRLGVFGFFIDTSMANWYKNDFSSSARSNVTSINGISLLTEKTQNAVEILLLHGNSIAALPDLNGFKSISILTLINNSLNNLSNFRKT